MILTSEYRTFFIIYFAVLAAVLTAWLASFIRTYLHMKKMKKEMQGLHGDLIDSLKRVSKISIRDNTRPYKGIFDEDKIN